MTFRDLAHAEGSPGATLRIEAEDLRDHLDRSARLWSYRPTGDAGSVTALVPPDPAELLREIYA